MAVSRTVLIIFLSFFIGMHIFCGSATAAGIRVVPSTQRVLPGEDFFFDVVAEGIPAEGLGGVQFRLNVAVPGGTVTGVSDLGQSGAEDVAIATPLLVSPATPTRSGIGDFFWNNRGNNGILIMDNEQLTGGSALYTFAHTNGATPPAGSGSVARFMVRVGSSINAKEITVSLNDVMLLDGGPAYPLDYNNGATVQIGCFTRMPDLAGLSLAEATARLAQSQLVLGSVYEIDNFSGNHSLDVVLEQSAQAGNELLCEAPINVALNTAPSEVTAGNASDKAADDTGKVTLSWTPSPSSDTAGYRIYQGATLLAEVKDSAAHGVEIGGLVTGVASQLKVTAYDTHGNESRGVTVVATPIDDVAPAVAIAGVSEGAFYRSDVTPQVSASDTNLAAQVVTLNGAPYAMSPISADGAYTLTVSATDRFANQTTQSVHFTIDKTPPAITVSGAANGDFYNRDVTPSITVTDVNLKENRVTLNGQSFITGTVITAEGLYTLVVSAEDLAGNTAAETISFVIDKTSPTSTADLSVPRYTAGGVVYISGQTPLAISAMDPGLAPSGVAGIEYQLDASPTLVPYSVPLTFAGLADGSHTVAYSAKDRATNRENSQALTLIVDNTPPITSLSMSGPSYLLAGGAYAATSATTFNLQATDLLAGVARVEYRLDGGQWLTYAPFAFTGEGSHTIEYRGADNLDNLEIIKSQAVLIDNTPPVTAVAVGLPQHAANDGTLYIHGTSPITLTATDNAAGVQKTEYRVDGGNWNTYQGALAVAAAGAHTVAYRSMDVVGNLEEVRSVAVVVDNTPPETIITVGEPKYAGATLFVKSSTLFTLSATDDLSGVAATQYRVDGGEWTPYAPFTIATEGTHAVSYRSSDNVGNSETEKSLVVIIDNTPPITAITTGAPNHTASAGAQYVTATTQFMLTATDNLAGVAGTEYRVDGGAWLSYTPFTISTEGSHVIAYRSTDNLGNREVEKSVTVIVDNTPPLTVITAGTPKYAAADDTLYGTSATTFTLTATDNLSGVAVIQYRIDGGEWMTYAPFTIVLEGKHIIGFRSTDNVGNIETEKSLAVTIDNMPPATGITTGTPQYIAADGTLYGTSATSFTLTATDSLSGVAGIEYRIDGGTWIPYTPFILPTEGIHAISFRSTDNVGNREIEKVLKIFIDDTPPVSAVTIGSPQYTASGILHVSGRTGITLAATDNSSGVKTIEYSIDGAPFVTYGEPFNLAAYADGSHTITYRSSDNLGIVEVAKQLSLVLDKTTPTTAIESSDTLRQGVTNTISPSTTFTLTATDNLSGVRDIWYRIDGDQWQRYDGAFTLAGFKAGSHTIAYSAVDNVENEELQQTVTVRLISFVFKKSESTDPVVLLFSGKNEDKDKKEAQRIKKQSDSLATLLESIGVSYYRAIDEEDFELASRSGRYNIYLLTDDGKEEAGAEIREAVYYGDGILFIKTRPDDDDHISDIFGVQFTGKSTSSDLVVTIPEGPLGTAGSLQATGKIARTTVTSATAQVLGTVTDKNQQLPALIYNEYGRGKALLMTFDLADSPDGIKAADLLAKSLNLLKPREHYLRPLGSIPISIEIVNSTDAFGLEVEENIPATATADTITPPGTLLDSIITWRQYFGATQRLTLGYYLNLPDTKGEYTTKTAFRYANYGTYRLYAGSEMTFTLEKDSTGLLQSVINDLYTLSVTDKKDRKRVDEALSELYGIRQFVTNRDAAEDNLERIVEAVEEVSELSLEATEIHVKLGELMKIWQRKWYLLTDEQKD
ncbi:OmpL47-type beta-barrel domain-containing protein [Geotalea toluenoxydans]